MMLRWTLPWAPGAYARKAHAQVTLKEVIKEARLPHAETDGGCVFPSEAPISPSSTRSRLPSHLRTKLGFPHLWPAASGTSEKQEHEPGAENIVCDAGIMCRLMWPMASDNWHSGGGWVSRGFPWCCPCTWGSATVWPGPGHQERAGTLHVQLADRDRPLPSQLVLLAYNGSLAYGLQHRGPLWLVVFSAFPTDTPPRQNLSRLASSGAGRDTSCCLADSRRTQSIQELWKGCR